MKDRLAIAIGITAFVAVIVGLILGAWIAYGHAEQQAERMMTEIQKLRTRTEAIGEELHTIIDRLDKAEALVFTRAVSSYYGADHLGRPQGEHGQQTASGQTFNAFEHTFAAWKLPFGTIAIFRHGDRVTWGVCQDRGPAFRLNRDVDISYAMGKDLGILWEGVAEIEMAIVGTSK